MVTYGSCHGPRINYKTLSKEFTYLRTYLGLWDTFLFQETGKKQIDLKKGFPWILENTHLTHSVAF